MRWIGFCTFMESLRPPSRWTVGCVIGPIRISDECGRSSNRGKRKTQGTLCLSRMALSHPTRVRFVVVQGQAVETPGGFLIDILVELDLERRTGAVERADKTLLRTPTLLIVLPSIVTLAGRIRVEDMKNRPRLLAQLPLCSPFLIGAR